MKKYLYVPFAEKEEAKQLGARWDNDKKQWYVDTDKISDVSIFEQWTTQPAPKKTLQEAEPVDTKNLIDEDFSDKVIIYADGASKGNPGVGGWGVVIYHDLNTTEEFFGGDKKATNNQMELKSAIEGLKKVEPTNKLIIVRSDSQYVCQGANEWLQNWKRNNWKTKNGEVKNQDLWKNIDSLIAKFPVVTFEWIKGHNGDPGNEKADLLANQGCAAQESN